MLRRIDQTADPAVPAWVQRSWDAPWLWMALVAILFCAPLFTSLHQQDFENDEAIYSFGVDTMLKDGDWLTPKSTPSETSPFLEKPPLKFWIVALPIKAGLLPSNEFGMRFWDAVMASVAFLYVFAIGRRLAGPICGFVAVFLLFTHGPLVLTHGLRTNNMEAAVFLSYAAGIYHFLAWRTAGPDDRGHIFAIVLYFVLGFMTKFVAALFLPLLLVVAALVKPEDRFRLRLNWLTVVLAGLLALVLIAPWFVYQQLTHPQAFFASILGEHVVKRFTAYLDPTHLKPWHFYFTELWSELRHSGSAALVVIGAGLLVAQTWRRRWLDGALVILWFAAPMVLISLGTSKLYHYAYPFLPPVALAGGYGVAKVAALIWRWLKRPALSIGGPAMAIRTLIPTLFVVSVLPFPPFRTMIAAMRQPEHVLGNARACLSPIIQRFVDAGGEAPGVWVEAEGISHRFNYYLRGLGPWQQRSVTSDTTVATHLFEPASFGPVLLPDTRYRDFMTKLSDDTPGLLERTARHAGVSFEAMLESFHQTDVSVIRHESAVLMLPGPFSACGAEPMRLSR